ncbi:MAG TPA: hypothetical protein VNA16_05830, partial [Abditibacteriaceae bacterium]|nr:hypothetical protein [Abditibacteriaceae bacterium]
PLAEVIRAATMAPARAMNREHLSSLSVGSPGDASVLEWQEGEFDYRDAAGSLMRGGQRLRPAGIVIAGRWWSDGKSEQGENAHAI